MSLGAIPWVLLVNVAGRIVNAWQIRLCLRAVGVHQQLWDIMRAQFVSAFYAFVVPGELLSSAATWYYLRSTQGRGSTLALALTFVKITNLASLLPLAAFGLALEPYLKTASNAMPLGFFALALLLATVLFLRLPAMITQNLLQKIPPAIRRHRWMSSKIPAMIESLAAFRRLPWTITASVVGASMVLQALNTWAITIVFSMADVRVPISVCVWIVPILTIINMVPVAIAGTGVREVTLVVMLQNTHAVDPARSMSASLLMLALSAIWAFVGACLAFSWRRGGRWSS